MTSFSRLGQVLVPDAVIGEMEAERVVNFTERLQAIDPKLDCFIWDGPHVPEQDLYSGFYYVRRINGQFENGEPDITVWRIQGPNGEFVEPNDAVLDRFREYDSWSGRNVFGEIRAEADRRAKERKYKANQAREEAEEGIKDVLSHFYDKKVAVTAGMKDKLKDDQ